MKKNIFIKLFIISFFVLGFSQWEIVGQEVIEIAPLFDYPTAPEDLENLEERCNYVVSHFWDTYDLKSTESVNQMALNDAVNVYLSTAMYANDKVFKQSLDNLLKKISGNPTQIIQFTKAVEEALYSPRAEYSSDEIYLRFLDAAIKNKKVSKNRKEKYQQRANLLRNNQIGQTAPTFKFINTQDREETYFPMSTPTILIFGDPTNTDWRLARIRMDSNFDLTEAIDKGKLNIIYISLNKDEGWKNVVSNYSKKWKVGISHNINDIYDIRHGFAIYLIGPDGKILNKNITLDQSITTALDLVNPS